MYEQLTPILFGGIALGIAAVAVKFVWSRFRVFRPYELPPALLLALAFWIGQSILRGLSYHAWVALILFAASGIVTQRFDKHRIPIHLFLIFSAALFLATGLFPEKSFVLRMFLVASIVCMVPAVAAIDRSFEDSRLVYWLFLASVGGIFTTVPDTEGAVLLFGILIAALIFTIKPGKHFFQPIGAAPFTGMLLWMIFEGGYGRPASIIVSIGCLGLLIVKPLIDRMEKFKFLPGNWPKPGSFLWFVLHCTSVTIAIGYARTTSSMSRASVVACAAILIPLCFAIVCSGLGFTESDPGRDHKAR